MMYRPNRWARRASAVTALAAAGTLAFSGLAAADTLQDTIVDTGSVALVAGSGVSGSAAIRLIANSAQGDPDPGCNIDAGDSALKLDIVTPAGVTANPDPLSITSCGTDFAVSFTASSSAVSGHVTVTVLSGPAGGGTYVNQVDIPITVTQPNTKPSVSISGVKDGDSYVVGSVPAPGCVVTDAEDTNESATPQVTNGAYDALGQHTVTCSYTDGGGLSDSASATYTVTPPPNTAPSVSVTGVQDGARYEIGSVPNAGCAVTDAEDSNPSATPQTSGNLSHGLGDQTVTCSYTDGGGLSDSDSATYTIVDTGNPTIGHTLGGTAGNNGWYKSDVTVHFNCDDSGSGVQSCEGDTTLGEGANQSVTGTATDWAGNTATDTVSGINIDETAPQVALVGGPTATYYYGNDPTAPTCDASDALSDLASCVVTGGGTSVGAHSYTATATDKAGNTSTASLSYTVLAWTAKGFYQPVDMSGVWNTVKGGSTVPVKFNLFAGSTELTSTSSVKSFTQQQVTCPGASAVTDAIEITSTGGTSLRYDTTAGQFVQNWATPKKAGTCQKITMTAQDGTSISASFMLK
jgi:hypothetical protein